MCTAELVTLLYHHYPKVRKEAAEKLYLALISSDELCKGIFKDKEAKENTMAILSSIEWTDKLRVFFIIHKPNRILVLQEKQCIKICNSRSLQYQWQN